ncbi:hypothetical protein [Haloferax volcanii]|uniref:Uncharacterized protein n=1 Tax=Haloferax volcanii TaxID=2246 RepID=A0A558FP72_HALVO|nr:hypothetical protein [Haloferax volcanii]TVT87308.1 hypothetical protein FQA18_19370 [Haloferax volcanii]
MAYANQDSFDLTKFIKRESQLFVVMGVFAAIAIYISQTPSFENSTVFNFGPIGFVSSLILTIHIFILILLKLRSEFEEFSKLRGPRRMRDDPGVVVFLLCFLLLLVSLVGIVIQQQSVILMAASFIPNAVVLYILAVAAIFIEENLSFGQRGLMGVYTIIGSVLSAVVFWLHDLMFSDYTAVPPTELSYSDPLQIPMNIAAQVTALTFFILLGSVILSTCYGLSLSIIRRIN